MADEPQPTLTVRIDADTRPLQDELVEVARLGRQFGTALSTSFVDVALKGKGLGDVLRSLALRLSEITLKAAFKPLTDALGGALAGALTGGGVAFAKGGVVRAPLPLPFAQGGVIASPIAFPLGGNRLGLAGERGPEAILPLARGPDGAPRRARGRRLGRHQRHLQRHHARRRQLPPLRDPDRRPPRPRRRPRQPQPVGTVSGESGDRP